MIRRLLVFLTVVLGAATAMAEPADPHGALYVPEPKPATTDYLVGAHYFPGWKEGTHYGWARIEPYPERKPLLGFYDEGSPEVADWEIKWATEHGIGFFIYCWYRNRGNVGKPVTVAELHIGHAIHEGLFRARYADRFRFAIMWENANAGGVASLDDLMRHLLPFWIESYFKRGNYLRLDGKPVLFVYHLDGVIRDLGGEAKVRAAFDRMRQACREAGLDGLTVLCEYRGRDPNILRRIKACGFDCAFAYCWHTPQRRPTADQAIAAQLDSMNAWLKADVLPFVPTASMGWDPMPWQNPSPKVPWLNPDTMTRWRLTPEQFKSLLVKVKALMGQLPADSLGRRMLILDNWNEWGEGHYLAPHAEHGFGYLQAVREVFTHADNQPDYRTPGELGLGPYDHLYREHKTKTPQK